MFLKADLAKRKVSERKYIDTLQSPKVNTFLKVHEK